MIQVRKSMTEAMRSTVGSRASTHFSFAGYSDPDHMGFRSLRVINEDRVQPAKGFDNHSKEAHVHFLNIWILPDEEGLPPAYDQRHLPPQERRGTLGLVASRDGLD